jgi:hypothetical protein
VSKTVALDAQVHTVHSLVKERRRDLNENDQPFINVHDAKLPPMYPAKLDTLFSY